jgi:hypothetical protein
MTPNVFNSRFWSLLVKPWHSLGIVAQEEMTAQEAWSTLMPYDFDRRDVTVLLNGIQTKIGEAIVRTPVPDDPIERSFGIVQEGYQLITPQIICETYDAVSIRPVETIGALGKGEQFFLSCKLPDYDIKGEQVEQYLLIYSPYENGKAIKVVSTPVRVVCQNTLTMGMSRSTQIYSGWHNNKDLQTELKIWLEHAIVKGEEQGGLIKQWFDVLARYQLEVKQATEMLFDVYPDPIPLPSDYPFKLREKKEKEINAKAEIAERNRSLVMELFEGAGHGLNNPDIAGTTWAWYNAVADYEDHRESKKSPYESILVGPRAVSKSTAFEVAYSVANTPAKKGGRK